MVIKMSKHVKRYVRMWPRAVFDAPATTGKGLLARELNMLTKQPGVYILYWDDKPYYIGKANNLRRRLWQHSHNPNDRYYNLWNHFSAFVIETGALDEIEGILIA